ncbi:MAG: antitoxin VapB family protein [Candidatus Micrarchaeaceae archaeon]|jgi:predicted CopG family antitoxin
MTKIISLTNEVYDKLKKLKKNKSFSKQINELLERSNLKGDINEILKYSGVWTKEEGKKFQEEISRSRKKAKPRFFDVA